MNDKQIRCFIQAATHQNFHQAAKHLFISQPALTYQIASLEKELDLCLFERKGRGVKLTPAGAVFYRDMIELSTQLDKSIKEAKRIEKQSESDIVVAWPPSILGKKSLLNLVDAYASIQNDQRITISVADRVGSIQMIEDEAADVIFTLECDIQEYPEHVYHPLYQVGRTCVLGITHPLSTFERITWDDLAAQRLFLVAPTQYQDSYSRLMDEARSHIPPQNITILEDISAIDINVAAGRGVSIRLTPEFSPSPIGSDMVGIPFSPEETTQICIAYSNAPCPKRSLKIDFASYAQEFFARETAAYSSPK